MQKYDKDNQKNYPTIPHVGSPPSPQNRSVDDRNIVPHKQTFAWLTMGIVFAFQQWNKQTCTKFLATMGLATWLQDLIADVKVNEEWDDDKMLQGLRVNPEQCHGPAWQRASPPLAVPREVAVAMALD